jgi:hypothetical protein
VKLPSAMRFFSGRRRERADSKASPSNGLSDRNRQTWST